MASPQRVVLIADVEFRAAKILPEELLRAHGLVPEAPYEHEEVVLHGTLVHRYRQPPRPRRPLRRDAP